MKREAIIYCLIQGVVFVVIFATCIALVGCKTIPHAVVPQVHNEYNGHDHPKPEPEQKGGEG